MVTSMRRRNAEEEAKELGKGYADVEGYRRADDLIPEESETVQLALKRLSPKEAYDRVFRMRRAFQVQRQTVAQSEKRERTLTAP